MASVNVDSELMTNYISAVPAPAGSRHVGVLDENRMPMLFCLSNDKKPRLRVLCKDSSGHSDMIDLHGIIELPPDAQVEAFHAEQSWSLKIFLCVAYKVGDSTSQISLSKPFSPETLKSRIVLPKIQGRKSLGTVQKIYMTAISGDVSGVKYPDIFLVHRNLDQSSSWGSDITHIRVTSKLTYWDATDELETPENTSAILDIAPAINPYGQGMYVLYVSQGVTKIYGRFIRPDPNADDGSTFTFVTNVACPKSARCIATVSNEKGYSCLLIAESDGIRYLNVREATSKEQPGKIVFGAEMFKNIKELDVVQDKSSVTLWFQTARDELAYARTDTADLAGLAVSSLLLPAGQVTAFAPIISRATSLTGNCVRQMVITNDKFGNLTLLEQTSDVCLWRRTPFYAPSQTDATELKSYTVNLKARDAKKQLLSSGAVFVSASSTLSVIINGRYTLLTQVPTWYDCDEAGSLDFIIPSDSLGSQVFRIESLKTQAGDILDFQQMFYDPAAKPMAVLADKVASLKDGEDFGRLKTSTGEPLLSTAVQKDKNTIAGAQQCLKTITQAYVKLPDSGASALAKGGTSLTKAVTNVTQQASASGEGIFFDGWHWICERIEDVTEWIVDTAGDVWKFVCKIAGNIKEFVLDCVEKICEAASWIWEKLKVGWEKLVDFIGFIFNWGDIIATKDSISSTLTAGFGYAGLKIDALMNQVDEFFDGIENTIDAFGDTIKTDRQLSEAKDLQDSTKSKKDGGGTSSNWAAERLKNGGAGSQTKASLKGAKPSGAAETFWSQEVAPAIMKLETEFSKLGDDLFGAFKDGSLRLNTVITMSARLLKTGVIAVRTVVKGLLSLVKSLIAMLSDVGNASISIPVFSWLYKKISGGHDLTLFDAISLIIAIPTTIISKALTGKAPPLFKNLDAPMLQKLVEGDTSLSPQTRTDWTVFQAEVALGTTAIAGMVGLIKVLYKMATASIDGILDELDEGPGSLFDIFGICVDLIGCITAMPEESDLPGGIYRNWISGIAFTRGAYHTIVFFTKSKSKFEKVILCLDLLTVLATLGLSIAVSIEEQDAAESWEDYDEDTMINGVLAAGLNAISGVCYFTAHMLKSTNPDISAGAAAIMVGTVGGTAVVEAISFDVQYRKDTAIRLVGPPAI